MAANPRIKTNGNGHEGVEAFTNLLQSPAANGFLFSQKLAVEATKFWARRMRAYADQMETLTKCSDPSQMVEAQRNFIERMQEDYTKESSHFTEMLSQARDQEQQKAREG